MAITPVTILKSDIVAGQKIYAANELARIVQYQGFIDDVIDKALDKASAQTVSGAKTFTGLVTLKDGSVMASAAAPTANAQIANKKYVDDDHPAYTGGESHTDGSGLITKMGKFAVPATSGTLTYGVAFPNAVVSVVLTAQRDSGLTNTYPTLVSPTVIKFDWTVADAGANCLHWIAIGY